jgi:TfoX N-terminal domain
MPRDEGLETMVTEDLGGLPDLRQTKMFGGMAWMWQGNLLCGARSDGILVRLGKGNDAWALDIPGLSPMVMGGRPMQGWVRLSPEAAGDDALRHRLLTAAKAFVAGLPPK